MKYDMYITKVEIYADDVEINISDEVPECPVSSALEAEARSELIKRLNLALIGTGLYARHKHTEAYCYPADSAE
jgi:hypothetical protein